MISKITNKKILIVGIIIVAIFIVTLLGIKIYHSNIKENILDMYNGHLERNPNFDTEYHNAEDYGSYASILFKFLDELKNDTYIRKYLKKEEIQNLQTKYYETLHTYFVLNEEEVDKILLIFSEKKDGYNSRENYTKYLGEKVYYLLKNDCDLNVYTKIYDNYITVEEKTTGAKTAKYTLVLKDKDLKILDVVEETYNNFIDDFKGIKKIEISNVEKIETYFSTCY